MIFGVHISVAYIFGDVGNWSVLNSFAYAGYSAVFEDILLMSVLIGYCNYFVIYSMYFMSCVTLVLQV